MAKVAVRTAERAIAVADPLGFDGTAATRAYFDGGDPLHLHRHDVPAGERLTFRPLDTDRIGYVWQGTIVIAGHHLRPGSSFIVERGATIPVEAAAGPAALLTFTSTTGIEGEGGRVHLLPRERVPHAADLGGSSGTGGGMHADSQSGTNTLWLHENQMPGSVAGPRRDGEAGIHSHSETEIIFVTDGEMRLGARLYGAGTALMIAADTLYSFTPGPNGLSFINFRSGRPGDIRFASGMSISETGYWRDRLPRPAYIEV